MYPPYSLGEIRRQEQRYVEAKNSPILLKRLKDFWEDMWNGRKAKRQDFKNKMAGHTIPKLPAESQEKLMICLNLYVVITTFQIKQNHVAVLLGES